MLLLSNLTRNGTIGGIAARKLELGIQESEQLPEEKNESNEDIEVEMNFGNTGGTQRRSDSAELPNVVRSGAEDSTLRSQQLEGVMTDVGGFSSGRQDSGAYRPRSDSRMPPIARERSSAR